MIKVLATTYAVNPYKGSEDGMGWNFVNQIARYQKVIAITRKNNRPHIEKYMKEFPSEVYENIEFAYFDLPYWMRFWKKGGRGAMLYYYMWQFFMPFFIRKNKFQFDVIHNCNFHNDWTPSFLYVFGKPFVWGPTGHHPKIPKNFLKPIYGSKAYMRERLMWMVKLFFWNIDLPLRLTAWNADVILAMNSSVQKVLGISSKKIKIMPSVSSEDVDPGPEKDKDRLDMISVGRFIPLKGFDVVIRAFGQFYHQLDESKRSLVSLTVVGDGPEKKYLKNMAKEEGVEESITFIDWIERKDLQALYQKSNLYVFGSHEGAGMVIAEAMSYEMPVVCFDNYGPGEFITEECGIGIPYAGYDESVHGFVGAMHRMLSEKEERTKMSVAARKRFEDYFDWNAKGEQLRNVYQSIING